MTLHVGTAALHLVEDPKGRRRRGTEVREKTGLASL
jgi:hypothetical protein